MKFAKELERDAVPEWRIKYLNYKAGKKHIKAVARAIVRTPRAISHHRTTTPSSFPFPRAGDDHRPSQARRSASLPRSSPRRRRSSDSHAPSRRSQSLATLADDDGRLAEHGNAPELADDPEEGEFELPAPAIRSPPDPPKPSRPPDALRRSFSRFATLTRASNASTPRPKTLSRRPTAGAAFSESPSHLRRIWTQASHQLAREHSRPDGAPLQQQLDVVRERERLFYQFLDAELEKVETFYKMKEQQAGQRLSILREQLHEMRSRRVQEIAHATDNQHGHDDDNDDVNDGRRQHAFHNGGDAENGHGKPNGWVQPIRAKMFPPGPNSKALRTMPETPHLPPSASAETRRDYSRRPEDQDVSYRTAKRKLKLALAELYRALELLKSYALLNRTAFRKLNKKYDKATNARVPLRYMHEKVNSAWFVNSDVLEGHIKAVEDLYARYFERGNHKLAAGKLRGLSRKSTDESGSSFLNGFLIGTGLVFCIQGLAYGSQLLFDPDAQLRAQTSYLMQLYAGYFLMLLLFALFCIDCFVWTKSKVNYPFIFEFDQRSHVDWRRLAEFPSFFLLLLGIFMWMNFSRYGAPGMYLYYPVILVGITILIIFFPAPVLAYKSRKWFVYAHWRLLLAGIYPVEFRDFFLGDMYCSLTYSMANVELFFCLYANQWRNPTQCNSSNSRVLGFLLTLPPIWRFLQCLRRYRDTRNVFPHLINAGKYVMTIVTYVVLSLYRINGSHTNLALFITFALVNSIYTSFWDLFMDFSLLQPHSRHFLLRDILALKRRWPYYVTMAADPVLRFSWIFYAIFTHNTQHSTIVSFLVSLSEVLRRGLWALFRVENEHCANVSQYKASRDVPLPYRIEPLMARVSEEPSPMLQTEEQRRQREQQLQQQLLQQQRAQEQTLRRQQEQKPPQQPGEALPTGASSTAVASTLGSLRRRADGAGARTLSKMMAEAHTQDFEKRRRPSTLAAGEAAARNRPSDDDDDDDDDEDEDEDEDAPSGLVRARVARSLRRQSMDA